MRALEEKVLIAEAATRDAEMHAEALQQLEKAEDDSARTFDAAVKAVTEATNNSAAAAAAAAATAPAHIAPTSTVSTAAQSSSVDFTTTSNKTPLSKMKKQISRRCRR